MSKKALLALLIAVALPLLCYLILKSQSDKSVAMPRKYLMDSVVTKIINNKYINDTFWHITSNIKLQNQLGDTIQLYDIKGKMIVLDFFFTHCGGICPRLTKNMSRVQQSFIKGGETRNKIDTSIVQFLSFTIDPQNDSVPTLKDYADRFNINSDNWWLLTGKRDSIYRFAFEELKVDKFSTEPVTPDFAHTSRFVLLDKNYIVRGYYDGLNRDSISLSRLSKDIGLLMLEKDKSKPSQLFIDIKNLTWLWILIIVIIAIFSIYITSRRKLNG